MLPEIKQLSESLANMIAAGEVIERPSSVVKELVENSLDANAKSIKIEIASGGLKKITVLDDGCGMSKDQIPFSLLRHATSKISNEQDLFNITSLGFRGEALPSIASVSVVTITSTPNTEDNINSEGYMYKFKAGQIIEESIASLPGGTKIEVENLFFNTPARFKHLNNEYLEQANISQLINRFALANPFVKFTFYANNKLLLQTNGDGNMEHLISQTYGVETAKESISFNSRNNLYEITGWASKNKVFKSNKNSINIIVNNRIIRNLNLIYAITDAYKTILPIGKYPIVTLEIICEPALIDVNVHPSKLEVRFTDETSLRGLITKTILDTLYKVELSFNVVKEDFEGRNKQSKSVATFEPFEQVENKNVILDKTPIIEDEIKKNDELATELLWEDFEETTPIIQKGEESKLIIEETPTKPVEQTISIKQNFFESLKYIGQFNRTYLIFEKESILYLIDQHAAMERVMYEKIKKASANKDNRNIELIVPITYEFTQSEVDLIISRINVFESIGIELSEFGPNTIIVRKIPQWVKPGLEKETISDIIDRVLNQKKVSADIIDDNLCKMIACKKSIKANMIVIKEEVEELLASLDSCEMPYTCPHGRPTIIKLDLYEIEKLFARVM